MKIFLIRHGETTGDIEDRYGGDYDDHLTEKGRQQTQELTKKLRDKGIEKIFHSPRIRAAETATIVGKVLDVPLEVVQDIRERNAYGVLTGLTKAEALEKYPAEVAELKRDKKRHKVSDSEPYDHFMERVINAFKDTTSQDHRTIAIISHGGPISCLTREFFKRGEFKHLGDCAILEIEKEGDAYKLISLDNAELEN
ncbi:histidine phosphatase family protein [Candidatus Woesearchaeota archaeon]|nr:histidine phosphatase family protein [Candidatus Woesearchaeota archaeon]